MPNYKNPVVLVVDGKTFTFSAKVLVDLPDAQGFLEGALARGVSAPVAAQYVKLVARLTRQGRMADLSLITHNVERTAANAYKKWKVDAYDVRIGPVIRAFAREDVKKAISWLRRGSLVPPFDGKLVPLQRTYEEHMAPPNYFDEKKGRQIYMTPPRFGPCERWTLHVPEELVPAHQDPCASCTVVEVTQTQFQAIVEAFRLAWGHQDFERVPVESLLFGDPPTGEKPVVTTQSEKAVALARPSSVSDALVGVHASVARDVDSFLARLGEGAEGVYLSREACGARLGEVLTAVWNVWQAPSAS